MFETTLTYIESWENEFRDKKYVISTFVEPSRLILIRGTNLNLGNIKKGDQVKAIIDYKSNKLYVSEIK